MLTLFIICWIITSFIFAGVFYQLGRYAGINDSCSMVEYISQKHKISTDAIKEIKDEIEQNYTQNAPVLDVLLGIIVQTEKELAK